MLSPEESECKRAFWGEKAMPAALDRAVDLCYRPRPFESDRQRVEHLFALYEKLTAPLIPPAKKKGRRKS